MPTDAKRHKLHRGSSRRARDISRTGVRWQQLSVPPSIMAETTQDQLIKKAEDAFWQVIVDHYPQAKHGDLSPERTVAFSNAAEESVNEWIQNNVPPHTSPNRSETSQQIVPDRPTDISRRELDDWMKPSHKAGNVPGHYVDTDGQYDIGVCGDHVTIYPWSKRLPKGKRSTVIQHPDESTWICTCRNVSDFQPCLKDGRTVEPTTKDWTDGNLYLCGQCGNVIDVDTLEIIATVPPLRHV